MTNRLLFIILYTLSIQTLSARTFDYHHPCVNVPSATFLMPDKEAIVFNNNLPSTYYVSGTGSDSNNGLSTTTAFRTLQKAADLVNPGDTVYAMNGTYSNQYSWQDVLNIARSGTAAAYIEFRNYPTHTPKIQFNGWQGIKFSPGAAYIKVSGFEIKGNNANVTLANALVQPASCATPSGSPNPAFNGNGISADGRGATSKPHHLVISNNKVYDCGGAGISTVQSDYITIENNVSYNNCWYTIYGTSGISLYQSWNFDADTSGYRNIIRNNRCFGNRLYVPWIGLCTITDGNGIIIDDSKNTQNGSTLGAYKGRTYVVNNVVWNNGGSGIHTYESEHVDIVNNTAYQNSQSTEINSGEIFANSSNDIRIFNNILVNAPSNVINSNYSNTNLAYNYNLHFGGGAAAVTGANTITGNPSFANANLTLGADFHITAGSAALNVGTSSLAPNADIDQNPRPSGSGYDIGAYEYASPLPVELLYFEGRNIKDSKNTLTWQTALETNTSHFELERSNDGRKFTAIGEIKAKGSNTVYQLDDLEAKGTQYYRLKVTDLDLSSSYSNIISLQSKSATKARIYPSVTNGFLALENVTSIEIINTFGQVVSSFSNLNTLEKLDIFSLPNGVYFIHGLDIEGVAFLEKIIKQ